MFKQARIKLTAWYLIIIMAISLSFSVAIFSGVNRELTRIEDMQKVRQERVDTISNVLIQRGFPVPPEKFPQKIESVEESRLRILSILGFINLSILVVAGLGGYFLAGVTLDPISKMVREQKEFIGNASHELRTPLTSLKTEIEVGLRDKKLDLNSAKKLLLSNLEEVNKIQRLSNYLLELNRLESGKTNFETKRVDLGKVVTIAIGKRKVKTDLKKTVILGDENALIELTTILLDNAFKYSGRNKIVEVKTKSGGVLEVKDHGVGISEKDLPHIFDKFYRGDKSRTKDGYGLGLSIAKSIVEKIGGKIKVESKVGHGSVFTVQLPEA